MCQIFFRCWTKKFLPFFQPFSFLLVLRCWLRYVAPCVDILYFTVFFLKYIFKYCTNARRYFSPFLLLVSTIYLFFLPFPGPPYARAPSSSPFSLSSSLLYIFLIYWVTFCPTVINAQKNCVLSDGKDFFDLSSLVSRRYIFIFFKKLLEIMYYCFVLKFVLGFYICIALCERSVSTHY